MLQSIHDKSKGLVTYLIVGLLILVFVMWGISYYLKGFAAPSLNAAEVNGQPILKMDFDRAYQSARSQQAGSLGDSAVQALKTQVLNALITRLLLSSSSENLGFGLSEETLSNWIVNDTTFQDQGKFSPQRYELLLQQLGINSQMLRAQIREGVLISQVQSGINQSTFLLPGEAVSYAALTHQSRRASLVVIPLRTDSLNAKEAPEEIPTDAQIQAYYQAHLSDFYAPNQIKIAYLDLKTTETYSPLLDQLANLTFENPDSLLAASKQLNLPIQESEYFPKAGGSSALTKNPKVLEAAFSKEVLIDGNNSDVIKISPTEAVVLRVSSQQQAHPQKLDEVKLKIIKILTEDQEKIIAKQKVDKLLQASDIGIEAEKLGLQYIPTAVYTQDAQNTKKLDLINPAIRAQLFQTTGLNSGADVTVIKTFKTVKGEIRIIIPGDSSFVLLNIKPSLPLGFGGTSEPLPSDIYEAQIHFSGLWGDWEYTAYQNALIDHAKIKKQPF